jgi:peptidoglycan hydrolase-like protein with peptidoglycan-binding domain
MKPLLTVACALAFVSAHSNMAKAVGPSFDCEKAQSFSERLLCVDSSLAEKELAFVQAYYSLRQQVGEAGWPGLKREILDFERDSLVQCRVPNTGMLPLDMVPLTSCLADGYTKQRSAWIARLRGPALEEASRSPVQNVALQQGLQTLGLLPSTARIDGVYGAGTRAAVAAWQQSRRVLATGFLGDADVAALKGQLSKIKIPEGPDIDDADIMPLGNHAGEEGQMVVKQGIGTASAKVVVLTGGEPSRVLCKKRYKGDDNEGYLRDCLGNLDYPPMNKPHKMTVIANCETGEFTDSAGRQLTYSGERAERIGDYIQKRPIVNYEGFTLYDSGYVDARTSAEQFMIMCPAGRPSGAELPELSIPSCDDPNVVSDLQHDPLRSATIVDVWDVITIENVWNHVSCSAKVTLNNGLDRTLLYQFLPRHGKIFRSRQLPDGTGE